MNRLTAALVAAAGTLTVATGAIAWSDIAHADSVRETCQELIAYRYEPEGATWTHTGLSTRDGADVATGYMDGDLWGDDPARVYWECVLVDGQLTGLHTWQ